MKRRHGFSLIELLVVTAIIGLLVGMSVPVLSEARDIAKAAICQSNLHQFDLGIRYYLEDHRQTFFPRAVDTESPQGVRWWYGWEAGSPSGTEPPESRVLDRKQARLYPYVRQYDSVEICPSFPYRHSGHRPKYSTNWITYGFNLNLIRDPRLSPVDVTVKVTDIRRPAETLLAADSAQIYPFQPDYFEEMPDAASWTIHFRHRGKANVLYCDGHSEPHGPDRLHPAPLARSLKIGKFGPKVNFTP